MLALCKTLQGGDQENGAGPRRVSKIAKYKFPGSDFNVIDMAINSTDCVYDPHGRNYEYHKTLLMNTGFRMIQCWAIWRHWASVSEACIHVIA